MQEEEEDSFQLLEMTAYLRTKISLSLQGIILTDLADTPHA